MASWFRASIALIRAIAGAGFMPEAVVQQAVAVLGAMAKKSCTTMSFGMKLIRPPVATISSFSPCVREYFAEVTVGAAGVTAANNSTGQETTMDRALTKAVMAKAGRDIR